MKKTLIIVLAFVANTHADCQATKRDSLANTINEYARAVNQAADSFLNRQLPVAARLEAMGAYPYVYTAGQVRLFKNTVLDTTEEVTIRVMALKKIYQHAKADENFFSIIKSWFSSPETPRILRNETLNLVKSVSFTFPEVMLDVYPKMVQDPDFNFRTFAISKLLLNGDARTQQLLITGLENARAALLPPAQAIELLTLSPKRDFYPAVYKMLQNPPDDSVRLIAIEVLGPYREARKTLITISQNANEKEPFRVAALGALYASDQGNIINYVTPILLDKTASTNLQVLGLQMTINARKKIAYRKKAKRADDYDQLVRRIADSQDGNQSEDLKQVANKYLLLVRPAFR